MDHKGAYKIHLGQTNFEGLFGVHSSSQQTKLIDGFIKTWEEIRMNELRPRFVIRIYSLTNNFFVIFPCFQLW
jgi:hypothetical protein